MMGDQLDLRPALVLSRVQDEERRRLLLVLATATEAPEAAPAGLRVVVASFAAVVALLAALC